MEPCTAKRRKSMDKSCRVYGNFHTGNHGTIAGRWAYIAVPTVNAVIRYIKTRFQPVMIGKGHAIQIPKSKVWINIQSRRVAPQTGEFQMLITPAQPLQTENGRWIVFKWVRNTKRSEFVDVRLMLFHVVRFDSVPIH